MERDVNVVVDVDSDEAAKLLGLIELLVEDWYVARNRRRERLQSIVSLGAEKDLQKAEAKGGGTHNPNDEVNSAK